MHWANVVGISHKHLQAADPLGNARSGVWLLIKIVMGMRTVTGA